MAFVAAPGRPTAPSSFVFDAFSGILSSASCVGIIATQHRGPALHALLSRPFPGFSTCGNGPKAILSPSFCPPARRHSAQPGPGDPSWDSHGPWPCSLGNRPPEADFRASTDLTWGLQEEAIQLLCHQLRLLKGEEVAALWRSEPVPPQPFHTCLLQDSIGCS